MKISGRGKKIHTATWQAWLVQWAELLQSGMPALDGLLLSSELQNGSRQGLLLQQGLVRTVHFLNEGQSFQTAFRAAFGQIPNSLEVSLLCAQASGDLSTALRQQTDHWISITEAQNQLAKSLIYPALVLMLAIACWVLLHQVSQPHLPSSTAAHRQTALPTTLLAGGGLLLLTTLSLKIRKAGQENPFLKWLPARAWAFSAYFHLIACELQAGLDLMHCLRSRTLPSKKLMGCIDLTGSVVRQLNQMTHQVHLQLRQGKQLGSALQAAGAPAFLVRQSQLAEQTGNLANCFLLAAKVYEIQAREIQQRLQNILPTLALALAALTLAMAYQFTLAPLYDNLTGMV